MKIAVIQSKQYILYDVSNPKGFDLETCKKLKKRTLNEAFEQIQEALKKSSQLIVTTEALNTTILPNDLRYNFLDFAEPLDGEIIDKFMKLSKRYKAYIVAGLYTKRNEKAYNSAILFNPMGEIACIYDKVHLAYGEEKSITAGNKFCIYKTEFGNVSMLICWDMQYPEAAREVTLMGADIIACPTWGWENIYGLCRAYENGVTIAAAMALPPSGKIAKGAHPSCIVDNMGRIIAKAKRNQTGIIIADIDTLKEPGFQYGIKDSICFYSMKELRLKGRRPSMYKNVVSQNPDVLNKYVALKKRGDKSESL